MLVAQRYELGDALGAGGEARVFRARDRTTGAEVALRLSAERLEILPSEPPSHPGCVRLLESGVDDEHGAYAVFELLQGETLDELVRAPLESEPWLAFARQSLAAVGALHDAGWIHGDLNAGNLFFQAGTTWKLLELPFHRTTRPALFGSIYTLAPEQINGSAPDFRSDLYALGCLFYYAAGGVYPHAGRSSADIAINRLRFAPEPLHAPALSSARAAWIMLLLARDPADRPASAAAAHQLLERTG